ncbi:MAG: hypothetical protein U1E73_01800 [Planctomycetota bacterium]
MAFDEARGRTVVFGGDAAGETWERAGDAWVLRTPAHHPPARSNCGLAYDPVRAVTVLFGGSSPTGAGFQDTWEWDGDDWQQIATPQSPPPIYSAAMTWHGGTNPGILLHGTFVPVAGSNRSTWQFDGTTWTLRAANAPAFMGSGLAYASSTQRTYAYYAQNFFQWELWAWDGSTWTLAGSFPAISWAGITDVAMAYDRERDVLVLAGSASQSWSISPVPTPQFAYGPNFVSESAFSASRRKLAYDTSRRTMVAFGGMGTFLQNGTFLQQPVNDVIELPSSSTGNWAVRRSVTPTPTGRVYTDMTYDAARGQMVLFGGGYGANAFNDTWTFDGATWTNHGAGYAARRVQPALAYEASLGTVLFGGGTLSGTYYGDTMYWTGSDWIYTLGGSAWPAARMGHDMVTDTARGRIVMFGGYNGTTLGDTWQLRATYYGPQWTQMATIGTPGPRQSHAMAYDQKRDRVVLFGGADAYGQFLGGIRERRLLFA